MTDMQDTLTAAEIRALGLEIERARAETRPVWPPGYVGYNEASEDSRIEAAIRRAGGAILDARDLDGVGSWTAPVRRIHYRSPGGEERWAYVLETRADVDAWLESSIVCRAPLLDDPDRCADAFVAARRAADEAHKALSERLDAIDARWQHRWPSGGRPPRALTDMLASKRLLERTRAALADPSLADRETVVATPIYRAMGML